jgi:hypothetical protein
MTHTGIQNKTTSYFKTPEKIRLNFFSYLLNGKFFREVTFTYSAIHLLIFLILRINLILKCEDATAQSYTWIPLSSILSGMFEK